jgi:hypothetical protein
VAGSDPSDDDRYLTDAQRQWRDWSAHGYRKLYQPTSILWLGGVFFVVVIAGLVALFYLAAHGQLP